MIFEEFFEAEEIVLKNTKGEEFKLSTKMLTVEDYIKIDEFSSITEKSKDTKEIFETVIKMMIIMLGKDETFWTQFSPTLLSKVNSYLLSKENKKQEEIQETEEDKKKIDTK